MAEIINKPNSMMTIKQVATYLNVHSVSVYRLINDGILKSVKIGGQHRLFKHDIDKIFEVNR